MKRKTRGILVRETEFGYVISEKRSKFPGYLLVKIWAVETKHGQKVEFRVRFDDFWINLPEITSTIQESKFEFRPVTPSEIRKMIEWALEFGWTPSYEGVPLKLDWCRERVCGFEPSESNSEENVGEIGESS